MICDAFCLFYFIKPYRHFFIAKLWCLKSFRKTKVTPLQSKALVKKAEIAVI